MDRCLMKTIEEFKEKLKNQESALDYVDLEKCLREFKTELYIKRDEVKQFRLDLDAANLENQSLKKALEHSTKTSDENQFNLNLVLKKSRSNEEELQDKRESLIKIQLQQKMTVAEVETLKEKLQKVEMEKIALTRKVDVFEAKQRHTTMYHNEILKRDNQLRDFMSEVNEMVVQLQAEHVKVMDLNKNTQLATEALEKLKHCVEEKEKLKKEKEHFEEMYIKINAKYEKLAELMANEPDLKEPNLLTKIIFKQWKANRLHNEAQIKQMDQILNKITESLNNEKSTNIKLIYENDSIKGKYEDLVRENVKLKELCKTNTESMQEFKEHASKLEIKLKVLENSSCTCVKIIENIKDEPIDIID